MKDVQATGKSVGLLGVVSVSLSIEWGCDHASLEELHGALGLIPGNAKQYSQKCQHSRGHTGYVLNCHHPQEQ